MQKEASDPTGKDSATKENNPTEDSSTLDKDANNSTVDKKSQEALGEGPEEESKDEKLVDRGSTPEVSAEVQVKSRADSVIEKRLATASVYGRSGPISAQRRCVYSNYTFSLESN